jgi:hypothetical protein
MCHMFCLTVLVGEPAANANDNTGPCIQLVLFGTDAEQIVGPRSIPFFPVMSQIHYQNVELYRVPKTLQTKKHSV